MALCQRRDVFREFGSSPVFLLRRPGLDLPSSAAFLAGLRVGRQDLGRPEQPGHGRVGTDGRSSWEAQWWGACPGRRAAPASSHRSAWPQEGAAEAEGWAVLLQACREHVHSKTAVPVFPSRTRESPAVSHAALVRREPWVRVLGSWSHAASLWVTSRPCRQTVGAAKPQLPQLLIRSSSCSH